MHILAKRFGEILKGFKMVAQSPAPKVAAIPKVKKESVTPVQRITDTLKRAAVANKISKDELETVANLAVALKTFMGA